jgi:hypothetical protein
MKLKIFPDFEAGKRAGAGNVEADRCYREVLTGMKEPTIQPNALQSQLNTPGQRTHCLQDGSYSGNLLCSERSQLKTESTVDFFFQEHG